MFKERPFTLITGDVNQARKLRKKLNWTTEELASDMLVTARQLIVDLEKYLATEKQAISKRVRTESKILESLGKNFRVQSVKSH